VRLLPAVGVGARLAGDSPSVELQAFCFGLATVVLDCDAYRMDAAQCLIDGIHSETYRINSPC